jgi:hypothetical protein
MDGTGGTAGAAAGPASTEGAAIAPNAAAPSSNVPIPLARATAPGVSSRWYGPASPPWGTPQASPPGSTPQASPLAALARVPTGLLAHSGAPLASCPTLHPLTSYVSEPPSRLQLMREYAQQEAQRMAQEAMAPPLRPGGPAAAARSSPAWPAPSPFAAPVGAPPSTGAAAAAQRRSVDAGTTGRRSFESLGSGRPPKPPRHPQSSLGAPTALRSLFRPVAWPASSDASALADDAALHAPSRHRPQTGF